MLSWTALGSLPSNARLLAIVPIVAGVAMASYSEATFNWPGFLAGLGSNLAFQSRNVLVKRLWVDGCALEHGALFGLITLLSLALTAPAAVLLEPAAVLGLPVTAAWRRLVAAAVLFHAYQLASFGVLDRVSPVTHAVCNCMKRVVLIVSGAGLRAVSGAAEEVGAA